MLVAVLAIMIGYLFGSLLTAAGVARLKGVNLRAVGSLNPGTSNAFTHIGPGWGVLVFFGDVAKTAVPMLAARFLFQTPEWTLALVGLGSIIGHDFPVFGRFRGGKGTASVIAAAFCFHWSLGLIVFGAVIVVTGLTDWLSLGGMAASLALPIALWVGGHGFWAGAVMLAAFPLSVYAHRSNIRNILQGTEPRFRAGFAKASGMERE